jgi:hypothetical protein
VLWKKISNLSKGKRRRRRRRRAKKRKINGASGLFLQIRDSALAHRHHLIRRLTLECSREKNGKYDSVVQETFQKAPRATKEH